MLEYSEVKKSQIMLTIASMAEKRNNLDLLNIESINSNRTAIFVVDMIKGFVKEGALADPRIDGITSTIKDIIENLTQAQLVFVNDAHSEESIEFANYPTHCLKNSDEGEIIDALAVYTDKATILEKNSTNGFVSEAFKAWYKEFGERIDTYIFVGDCTDICIKQFALTLKAYFNEKNLKNRVIVPADAVETFHLDATLHHADLMNIISLYEMEQGGVEIVKCMK